MPSAARDRFVDEMATALTRAGLPRLPSRVFSALLADDDGRMTSAELAEALGISAAGVSGAVTYLGRVNMIRQETVPGGRRHVYVVDDDAWHDAMVNNARLYAPMADALDRAIGRIPADAPERHRLELTREFLRFVTREMELLAERWERHKRSLLRGRD